MGELSSNHDNVLLSFPPCLRSNMRELCLNGEICLTTFTINDITVVPSHRINEKNFYSYHYIMKVPYAGKRLSWEIIFNPEDFYFAPDFDFSDDSFLLNADVDIIEDNVPSLLKWDVDNPKSMLSVLREFVNLYRKIQIEKLNNDIIYSHIRDELSQLDNYNDNVEIFVDINSVHVLISIELDCSQLPHYIESAKSRESGIYLNPGKDFANLRLIYLKLDGSQLNSSIQLSPTLDQYLTKSNIIKIPEYKHDLTLAEYVKKVTNILQSKIETVVAYFEVRKRFILNIAVFCSDCLIEYDADSYMSISFLYKLEDYRCLVHVNVGTHFPDEKPHITLQSIYCQENVRKCTEKLHDFNYDPTAKPSEITNNILSSLKNAVARFKNHRH